MLAIVARLLPTNAYRDAIARTLSAVSLRKAVDERGRMVGDLLLAIDETRGVR